MSKLLELRGWLTVEQAAEYLSEKWNEPVTDKDIYTLALARKCTMSICFSQPVQAQVGVAVPRHEAKHITRRERYEQIGCQLPAGCNPEELWEVGELLFDQDKVVEWEEHTKEISGLWDLPLHPYSTEINMLYVSLDPDCYKELFGETPYGHFLSRGDTYARVSFFDSELEDEEYELIEEVILRRGVLALSKFELARLCGEEQGELADEKAFYEQQPQPKSTGQDEGSLGKKGISTYLKIINALLKSQDIDIEKKGQPEAFKALVTSHGCDLCESTLANKARELREYLQGLPKQKSSKSR